MLGSDPYIALISSLPSSERLFFAKQPPLTRLSLDRRLMALTARDRQTLSLIEGIVRWSAYSMDDTAKVSTARVKAAMTQISEPTLRSIIAERMDTRTVMAALRLRRDGATAAPKGIWGLSRWTQTIAANWSDPTFKLERAMPWLPEAKKRLDAGDPLELERYLLDVISRQLQRHAGRHSFDFEAVVIYVLKWHIFDRWAQADASAAAKRFAALANEALQDFPDLMRQGEAA